MILAPWNDPIYFIVWLVILELVYVSIFTLEPFTQLGVVSSYILGWIIGRQFMVCYEDDPFIPNSDIWNESSYNYSSWINRITSMFQNII